MNPTIQPPQERAAARVGSMDPPEFRVDAIGAGHASPGPPEGGTLAATVPDTEKPVQPTGPARRWAGRGGNLLPLALVAVLVLGAALGQACSVPVFRYALERWQPAPYEAIIFHRGPLSAAQTNLVLRLSGEALSNQAPANLTVRAVNLEAQPAAELLEIWKSYQTNLLPALVVRFPQGAPAEGTVWAGLLSETNVQRVLESPVRKRIVRSLVRGDSAVWLLLESGDRARDDAAARLLETRLEHLRKTLKLPTIEPDDLADKTLPVPESALKVAFSLVRLSRADPAEAVLVHCLLGTEDDLKDGRETMAFPIFGRGRALCALVGEGINTETIDEASEFLVGPCSCVVKEQNPGLDLLMASDWDSQIRIISAPVQEEPPPLTGLTAAVPASNAAVAAAVVGSVVTNGSPAQPAPEPPGPSRPLWRGLLVVLGLAVLILGAGTILLRRV
jgi:hypothetical protein